jgi:asparagine synthase (glutamine-hydrolysing)
MQELGANAYIDGGGGNNTLTWDGARGLSTLFRTGRWIHLAREAAALGNYRLRSTVGQIWYEAIKPHLPRPLHDEQWLRYSSINRQTAAELDMAGRIKASGHDPSYVHAANRQVWLNKRLTVNRSLLGELNGWVRSRYGLEVRRPMMDMRVIRFCMAMPEDQFLRNGQKRWLARRLLREAGVPSIITENKSRGDWCPEWFTHLNERRPLLASEIARMRASTLVSRLIDVDRIAHIVDTWPADAAAAEPRRLELDILLTRALHVGAFIQWAESKDWSSGTAADGCTTESAVRV